MPMAGAAHCIKNGPPKSKVSYDCRVVFESIKSPSPDYLISVNEAHRYLCRKYFKRVSNQETPTGLVNDS